MDSNPNFFYVLFDDMPDPFKIDNKYKKDVRSFLVKKELLSDEAKD